MTTTKISDEHDDNSLQDQICALEKKLSVANSEIEELKEELHRLNQYVCCAEYATGSDQHSDECVVFKHTTLLAAAERLYRAHNERAYNGTALEAVRLAIQAG